MRTILTVAAWHLRLELRDRTTFFWMLVMPLAFITIFGRMFGSGGSSKTGLAVADADSTFLSRSFVQALSGEDLALRRARPSADTSAIALRTLLIPRGFSDSLAEGKRITLRYRTRPDASSDNDLEAKVYIYKSIVRVLAILAESDTMQAAHRVDLESAAFQQRYQAAVARPDLITADVRPAGRGRALPSGFAGSAESMLVLFLMINTAMSGAVVLTQEKQSQVLSRVATLPIARAEMLAGKMLGLLGMALLQSLVVVVLGSLIFRVPWGPSPLSLIGLLICLGLAAAGLGLLLGGLLRTPEQAGAVGWLVPLFLCAIGGTWWPLEVAPGWMRAFGHISPAAWAMDGLHGLINFGHGPAAIVLPGTVLLGYAAATTILAARSLRVRE